MPKKIKIAMLVDCYGGSFIGGGQIHTKYLTQELQKQGCEVIIFSQKNDSLWQRFWWSVWAVPVLFLKIKDFNIIHAQGHSMGPPAWILAKLWKKPVVLTVHGSHLLDLKQKGLQAWLEKLFLLYIPYDLIITVSPNFLDYKNLSKKTVVISNGVVVKENISKIADSGKIKLLFVGRLVEQKGVVYLIKALDQLSKKFDNWELEIVGEGPEMEKAKHLVQSYQLDSKIKFLGRIIGEKLSEIYQKAQVFVLPSLAEGQPITLLEAWSHKLVAVVSRVGANPSMIKHGQNGLLIKAKNSSDLAEKLTWLLTHNQKIKEIGQAGYEQVSKYYQWPQIAEKTLAEYKKLV
ncbi:glycosyltransferase family 4 protein [Candidatus Beckwithbacteria bacterium]|nr:glycosyltransferase family 4 protein [Candidatus Beckwithbacteria bacterium]